jgi:toxin ParE1/3/4
VAKVRLAELAREDARHIRIYSKAAFGIAMAREYMSGLRRVFVLLGERPLAGAVESDLGDNIRSFVHRSHRIYYRVDSEGVMVVRILHHAQDIRRALGQDH